ncbi:MAG: hypothetical protein ACI4EO_01840 [Blautia sp.]
MLKKDNRVSRTVQYTALLLLAIEIIVWTIKGMNEFLLVAILATSFVEVSSCVILLRRALEQLEK